MLFADKNSHLNSCQINLQIKKYTIVSNNDAASVQSNKENVSAVV